MFFVKSHTLIPALGNFNSELVSARMVTLCYSSNTFTAILEDMWCPPKKIRVIKKVLCSGILSNFNWVAFLEIHQALPYCSPIFPFNKKVPTLGCFPQFVLLPYLMYISSGSMACPSVLWSTMPSISLYCLPSMSHWAYIFSAITFAVYSSLQPSGNSIS
jgi:hypothetical protein